MEVPLGDTYYFTFTTRSFSTGAPTTLAGTPVLSVKEEANDTVITTGVSVDVDTGATPVTGLHEGSVIATTGNGYEVGKYYSVYISTGTVGGVSVVGETVGHFRIMPAEDAGAGIKDVNTTHVSDTAQTANDNGADLNTLVTRVPNTLNTTASGNIGIDWANVENPTSIVDLSATDIQLVDTCTTNTDMRGTDNALLAASAPTNFGDLAITITTGEVTVGTNNDKTGYTASSVTDKTGYSISGTKTTLDALNDIAATDIVSAGAITTLAGAVVNVDTVDTLTTYTGNTPQTGDNFARLGAPAGASVSADIAGLQTDTDDIQTRLPAALVSGKMDSDVQAINASTTAAVQLALSANEIENGQCEGTPTTTVIQTDLAETQDDIYIGRVVIFTSGSARGEATDITDYTGSTGTLTVTALANAPAATDTFILI